MHGDVGGEDRNPRQGSSVAEQGTHKPLVGSSNLPLGTRSRTAGRGVPGYSEVRAIVWPLSMQNGCPTGTARFPPRVSSRPGLMAPHPTVPRWPGG